MLACPCRATAASCWRRTSEDVLLALLLHSHRVVELDAFADGYD